MVNFRDIRWHAISGKVTRRIPPPSHSALLLINNARRGAWVLALRPTGEA